MHRWRTYGVKSFFIGMILASMFAQWTSLTFWGFFVCVFLILLVVFYERVFRK